VKEIGPVIIVGSLVYSAYVWKQDKDNAYSFCMNNDIQTAMKLYPMSITDGGTNAASLVRSATCVVRTVPNDPGSMDPRRSSNGARDNFNA
jgi:hypothetical protein